MGRASSKIEASRRSAGTRSQVVLDDDFVATISDRIRANQQVRRTMPIWGRLHVDRQLPFLCVYRRPPNGQAAGTDSLVTSEPSYLTLSGAGRLRKGAMALVRGIAEALVESFGACLLLEVWAGEPATAKAGSPEALTPRFRIVAPRRRALGHFLRTLEESLSRIDVGSRDAEVSTVRAARCTAPGFGSLLSPAAAQELGVSVVGLEVSPIYQNPKTGTVYPLVLRDLRRELTKALRQALHAFTCHHTSHCPVHYHVLGRRATVKAVWEIDRKLAEVSDQFDFLLQVTPINAAAAWRAFEAAGHQVAPVFDYRPLPIDPIVLKRGLYETRVERVEDPALGLLFREKVERLDRAITMLDEIDTPDFLLSSRQLYGGIEDELRGQAVEILERYPTAGSAPNDGGERRVGAKAMVRRAERELAYYQAQWPEVRSNVAIRGDIAGGLMVSRGGLLVSKDVRIPASRVDALLQHEVGTHLLTYYNGRAQPFKQLYTGLADYETLQEGLAVLAEHFAGGLSAARLRVLAARVLAVDALVGGASFIETFRLMREHRFSARTAFSITLRVHRGGGLTKDAIYLRGLQQVLDYFAGGGKLEPLLVGKIAADHVPIIEELRWRQVLCPPPLRPRYLEMPGFEARLARLRDGARPLDLVEGEADE